MRERPILMSAPMVRALLAGTKTQTRRVAKPVKHPDFGNLCDPGTLVLEHEPQHVIERACPYGQPGDRLWVRETWNTFDGWAGYFYAADDHSFGIGESDDPDHVPEHALRWRPSIHMPRWASRITLEVTDVRVQRLQEISETEAQAEGVEQVMRGQWRIYGPGTDGSDMDHSARTSFCSLWSSINGPGSWDANPWVWVVSFRRLAP